jgi:hypothetical protein
MNRPVPATTSGESEREDTQVVAWLVAQGDLDDRQVEAARGKARALGVPISVFLDRFRVVPRRRLEAALRAIGAVPSRERTVVVAHATVEQASTSLASCSSYLEGIAAARARLHQNSALAGLTLDHRPPVPTSGRGQVAVAIDDDVVRASLAEALAAYTDIALFPSLLALLPQLEEQSFDVVVAVKPRATMQTAQSLLWAQAAHAPGVVVLSDDESFDALAGVQRRFAPAGRTQALAQQIVDTLPRR